MGIGSLERGINCFLFEENLKNFSSRIIFFFSPDFQGNISKYGTEPFTEATASGIS